MKAKANEGGMRRTERTKRVLVTDYISEEGIKKVLKKQLSLYLWSHSHQKGCAIPCIPHLDPLFSPIILLFG